MQRKSWGYSFFAISIILVACSSELKSSPLARSTSTSILCTDKPLDAVRFTCTDTHKSNASIVSIKHKTFSFRKLLWDEHGTKFTIKQGELPNWFDDPTSSTLNYYNLVNNSAADLTSIWGNQWSPKIFQKPNENVFYSYYFADVNASGSAGDRDIMVMELNGGDTAIQPLTPLSEVINQTRVTRDPILANSADCRAFEPSLLGCYPLLSANPQLADKINCIDNLSFDTTINQFKQQSCINHSSPTIIPIDNGFVSLYSAGVYHYSNNSKIYGVGGYFDKSVVLKTFKLEDTLPIGQRFKEINAIDVSLLINDILLPEGQKPLINCDANSLNSNLKTPIRLQINPSGIYINSTLYIAYVTQIHVPDSNNCYVKEANKQRFDLISLQKDPSDNNKWVKKQHYKSPTNSDGFIDTNMIYFKNKIFVMARTDIEELKVFRLSHDQNGVVTDDSNQTTIFGTPWDLTTNMQVKCRNNGNTCSMPKSTFPYINQDDGSTVAKLKILYLFNEDTNPNAPYPITNVFSVTLPDSIACGPIGNTPNTCNSN